MDLYIMMGVYNRIQIIIELFVGLSTKVSLTWRLVSNLADVSYPVTRCLSLVATLTELGSVGRVLWFCNCVQKTQFETDVNCPKDLVLE